MNIRRWWGTGYIVMKEKTTARLSISMIQKLKMGVAYVKNGSLIYTRIMSAHVLSMNWQMSLRLQEGW